MKCKKCGAALKMPKRGGMPMKVTGIRCDECGHFNKVNVKGGDK